MRIELTKFLKAGDVLHDSVVTGDGVLILSKGTILGPFYIKMLQAANVNTVTVCTTQEEVSELSIENFIVTRTCERQLSVSHRFVNKVLRMPIVSNVFTHLPDQVKEHAYNVAIYTAILTHNNNMCNLIGMGREIIGGALLHDIGKTMIPDDILNAPRRLTDVEFNTIKLHTVAGHSMLVKEGFGNIVTEIALSHHETFTGDGYPRGIGGKEIPWYVDLVHICDIYDALCAKRVYKKAKLRDTARNIIIEEKDKFLPSTFEIFMEKMPRYLLGDLLSAYNRIYTVIGYSDDNDPILRDTSTQQTVLFSEIKGKAELLNIANWRTG